MEPFETRVPFQAPIRPTTLTAEGHRRQQSREGMEAGPSSSQLQNLLNAATVHLRSFNGNSSFPTDEAAAATGSRNAETVRPVQFNTESGAHVRSLPSGRFSGTKARRDRLKNWQTSETLVLIAAKREQYLREKAAADPRDLMIPEFSKWAQVAEAVMSAGFSPCIRDGASCKTKWNQLVPDYKRIADYFACSGQNIRDYWDLNAQEKIELDLPKQFNQEFFVAIHEWYCARATINPVHLRDPSSPYDCNFLLNLPGGLDSGHAATESDSEDLIAIARRHKTVTLSTEGSSLPAPRTSLPSCSEPSHSGRPTSPAPEGLPPNAADVGPAIHILSSSGNTAGLSRGRAGNTSVKRKSLSGPALIADATKVTGSAMAEQMKLISDASLQVECNKVDVHLRIFEEQMSYQREKDQRIQESIVLTHENARLALLKQHEMVKSLQELTAVLGAGLLAQVSSSTSARHGQAKDNNEAEPRTDVRYRNRDECHSEKALVTNNDPIIEPGKNPEPNVYHEAESP